MKEWHVECQYGWDGDLSVFCFDRFWKVFRWFLLTARHCCYIHIFTVEWEDTHGNKRNRKGFTHRRS